MNRSYTWMNCQWVAAALLLVGAIPGGAVLTGLRLRHRDGEQTQQQSECETDGLELHVFISFALSLPPHLRGEH